MPAESLHVSKMEGFVLPAPDPPANTPFAHREEQAAPVAAPAAGQEK